MNSPKRGPSQVPVVRDELSVYYTYTSFSAIDYWLVLLHKYRNCGFLHYRAIF